MSKRSTNNIDYTNNLLRGEKKAMKIVHIKTQYVETDATSFKSVVQNLTGKYSTIPESPRRYYSSSPSLAVKVKNRNQNRVFDVDNGGGGHGGGGSVGVSGGCKLLSTRDNLSFDMLFKDFSSVDELHKLLTFD